jgi:hypothetical protein
MRTKLRSTYVKKDRYAFLPDRARLGIGLVTVALVWWLYVLPRDMGRASARVARCSWYDVRLLWKAMIAGERIDYSKDPLDLNDE